MKKNQHFFKKVFFAYSALLAAVVLSLFFFIILFSSREERLKTIKTQTELVSKVQSQLDDSLRGMDRIINGLLFDETFLAIMRSPQDLQNSILANKEVVSRFTALDAPLFTSNRIIAFNHDNHYTLSKHGDNQVYIQEALARFPWWGTVTEAAGNRVILPVHPDTFSQQPELVYSVARAIMHENQCLGIIEVQNDYRQLKEICTLDAPESKVVVFSQDGTILYPFEDDTAGSIDYSDIYQQVQLSSSKNGNGVSQKHQFFYSRSDYSGWTTALYVPIHAFPAYTAKLIPFLIFTFLILLCGLLLLIYFISKRLTQPLLNLNKAVKDVSLDNLSLSLPDAQGIEEIEELNRSFKEMFCQLKQAIAQSVQSRANEERASYLALSAQMNPHTLYNTISMIESVSYIHGDKEVSGLCISLSNMMRYISDYTRRIYTVQDELQYLSCYTNLVCKRYEGRLFVYTNCDSQLEHTVIPKFTIQPLVENALKHGLSSSVNQLDIHVSVEGTPDNWCILVQDNGRGFSQESIDELYQQFRHCDECLTGGGDFVNQKIGNLGLSNLYIRCRLMWKKAFTLTLGNCSEHSGAFVKLSFQKDDKEGTRI